MTPTEWFFLETFQMLQELLQLPAQSALLWPEALTTQHSGDGNPYSMALISMNKLVT